MHSTPPTRGLLDWLSAPSAARGAHFALSGDEWEDWSYARLAQLTRQVARYYVEAGLREGDRVALVLPAGPTYIASLFGALLAGCTPATIAPAAPYQEMGEVAARWRRCLLLLRPALVVTEEGMRERVREVSDSVDVRTAVLSKPSLPTDGLAPSSPALPDTALLQMTSGSSGAPRAVRVSRRALEANLEAIRGWLGWTPSTSGVSWLPVHHDMGLIGCLLSPVVHQSELWLLQPEHFIRRPGRYLRCMGQRGARITATPSFGLDYMLRRVKPADLSGLDFSGVETVIVGAERVDAALLERFVHLLAPFGLRREALRPAYGLAENTLAVTGLARGRSWVSARVRPRSLALGARIELAEAEEDAAVLAGCGSPLASTSVAIENEQGEALPDGHVGEIVVESTSLADGYVGADATLALTAFRESKLHTGDAGFVLDDNLFVIGRIGDSMKVRGRTLFAEDLEASLVELGIPGGSAVVLLGTRAGVATVVGLFETPAEESLRSAAKLLRSRAEGADLLILRAPKGSIERTTSGKPRRRPLWEKLASDAGIPGVSVVDPSRLLDVPSHPEVTRASIRSST